MSLVELRDPLSAGVAQKITIQTLLDKKRSRQPISALTAYDYPIARLIDEVGIDIILVGDSLAMATLGYDNTLPVTMEEMLHHVRAVRRAVQSALLVADMPYGSYHSSTQEALSNAIRFIKEGGAAAVKIEGGSHRVDLVARMTDEEIPVVGHIGLTPQSLHRMGGYRVQGKSIAQMDVLAADAIALQGAGAVAVVLEGVPRELAARITREIHIPTIGIGAGPDCDGQILVFHDLFNLTFGPKAKFVRGFGDARELFREGLETYRNAVSTRDFPNDNESYHLSREVSSELSDIIACVQQQP